MTTVEPTPEQAVLGAALIRSASHGEAASVLTPDDFEHPAHRAMFEAMSSIVGRGGSIDLITLEDELHARGERLHLEGGVQQYALRLAAAVPTAENVLHYADIVAKQSARRRMKVIGPMIEELSESDPEQAQQLALEQQTLLTQVQRGRRRPGVDMADLVQPLMDQFEARARAFANGDVKVVGLSTGISGLDYLTNGLHAKTLNIIAARTSLGKTALACQMALFGALVHQVPAIFFSLEMDAYELEERFFARVAKVNSSHLRTGELALEEFRRLTNAATKMSQRGLVSISNARKFNEIAIEAKAFRVSHPNQRILVVVDYLQLVRVGKRRTREEEVAEVSGGLKSLAFDLDCPVVAPAQLKRDSESEGRDPIITDIRESGAIENDADLIAFIVRARESGESSGWLKVVKNRNGATGDVAVEWRGPTYEMRDAEQGPAPTEAGRFS